jgi:hypothetical protein
MQTLKKNHQRPLYEALLKIKEGTTPRKKSFFYLFFYSETYVRRLQ